jgi:hypothetical protein
MDVNLTVVRQRGTPRDAGGGRLLAWHGWNGRASTVKLVRVEPEAARGCGHGTDDRPPSLASLHRRLNPS